MNWGKYWAEGMVLLFLGIGSWFDLKIKALPVLFFWVFGTLGLLGNLIWNYQGLEELLLGGSIGCVFLLIGYFSKESIGYGDGIGIIILGIFMGSRDVQWILLYAFLLSGIYGILKKILQKASVQDTFPFFPFLLLAALGRSVL